MPDKAYLSIREVSERFGVDYKTIYRQIQAGELPAAKVGGVYRISEEDMLAYAARRHTTPRDALAMSDLEAAMVAERASSVPDEARAIAEDLLSEAQERLRNGEIDVLVTTLQAKQRELSAINRFDRKLRELVSLKLPDGQVARFSHPERNITRRDQSDELMNVLNVGYLERGVVDRLPINTSERLTVQDDAGKHVRLIIEICTWSDLCAFAQQGFSCRRLTLSDLLPRLAEGERLAEKDGAAYILGLASTSGWAEDAQSYVDSIAEEATSYTHHLLMPVLVDLTRNISIYDRRDTRVEPYVGLFTPVLRDERVAAAARAIEETLLLGHGLSMSELPRVTGAAPDIVQAAAARLVSSGKYQTEDVAGVGVIITPVH